MGGRNGIGDNTADYAAKYGTANGVPQLDVSTLRPFLKSRLIEPGPDEAGLKETVKANPGQVTVVRARFSLPAPPSTAQASSSSRKSTCTTATSSSTKTTT
jgi:hypothetical protein